ncbi:hypothetical protein D3C75_886560 [compost metagenome]
MRHVYRNNEEHAFLHGKSILFDMMKPPAFRYITIFNKIMRMKRNGEVLRCAVDQQMQLILQKNLACEQFGFSLHGNHPPAKWPDYREVMA